jgi:hypothetical protein
VNLLVRSLEGESVEAQDASEAEAGVSGDVSVRVVRALEDLQRRDPNRYVRLRSAAALRQINQRDVQ